MLQRPEKTLFRYEIQGLRAVAVLAVLIYHIFPQWLSGGYVGVDVFFVISGYLITGLLLREAELQGRIDLVRFYGRRIRRLLPAASLVLLLTASAYTLLPNLLWGDLATDLFASTFYLQNWWLASQAVDYLMSGNAPGPLQHFWSLAVEEQYYIVWPLLLSSSLLLYRQPRRVFVFLLVSIGLASLIYSSYISSRNPGFAYFATTTRVWELALGGVLAVFPSWQYWSGKVRNVCGWLGMLAIVVACTRFDSHTVFPGTAALLPTLGSALVIISGVGKGFSIYPLLTLRPLQYVGGISYSLYLWHWPVIVFVNAQSAGGNHWQKTVFIIAVSVLLSHFSRYYVEDRFRTVLSSRTALRGTYTMAVGLAVLVSISALWINYDFKQLQLAANQRAVADSGREIDQATAAYYPSALTAREDKASAYDEKCITTMLGSEPGLCYYGNPRAEKTVVVIGDSHAVHWLPALKKIAVLEDWRLVAITKSACAYGTVPSANKARERDLTCVEWNAKLRVILLGLNPDIYVFSQSIGNFAEGASDRVESAELLAQGLIKAWQQHIHNGKLVVAIKDTPRLSIDVPVCLSRAGATIESCGKPRSSAVDRTRMPDPLVIATERLDNAYLIDMTDYICDEDVCPAVKDRMLLWRDGHHLTATFATSLSPQLHSAFKAVMKL